MNIKDLFIALYKHGFIQTVWNAEKEENKKKGWVLVSGQKVPWYFNMRPIGDAPKIFYNTCLLMAAMIKNTDTDLMIGVEMAGVPLVGGISVASCVNEISPPLKFGYTRPLPRKARNPEDVIRILGEIDGSVQSYGQKDFVEARMYNGMNIAVVDDMSTTLGSKIVARQIILWEAQRRGVKVNCNKIFYFLDRGDDNIQAGLDFAKNPDERLHPEGLDVQYVLKFNDFIPLLEEVMSPDEYSVICEHQRNSKRFGLDEDWRNHVIALANK